MPLLFPTVVHALPPPRPGLVDPYTLTYRTTGNKLPVFPREVRTYRQSPRKGRVPLDPKRAAAKAGVRPLAVDTSVDNTLTPLVLLDDRQAVNPNQSAANAARCGLCIFRKTGAGVMKPTTRIRGRLRGRRHAEGARRDKGLKDGPW